MRVGVGYLNGDESSTYQLFSVPLNSTTGLD